MKTIQVLPFPASVPHHQQHACIICQKTLTTQDSVQNKMNKGLGQTVTSCSTLCTNIVMHATQAFVQGFLIGWVLCLFCRKPTTECYLEKVVCGRDAPTLALEVERDEDLTVKNESVEGLSSVTGVDENSLMLFKADCEEEQMNSADLDGISTSVHFGMDLFHEPRLDSHRDLHSKIEDKAPVGKRDSVMFASSRVVSDNSAMNNLSSISDSEQLPSGYSTKAVASGTLLVKQNSITSDNSSQNGKNSVSDSTRMQSSHKKESFLSNEVKRTLNHNFKSDRLKTWKKQNAQHTCVYCCKSFCNKRLLKEHVKSHNSQNGSLEDESQQSFACEFCAQIFMNRYSLKAHIRRKHSGEEPVACDVCGKVQPGTFALSAHKNACHNFNSLCHICGAEFSGRTSFDKHMASHEGVKRYFCDICGAGFVHNSSLNNHRAVHLTTKSYQCDICSQMFKVRYLLNEHLVKTHQCGPSLEHRIRGLKKMGIEVDRHAITRHANHQCVVCGELLVDGACVSHPDNSQEVFHCPTCGDMTSNIVLFYQHIKWHRGMLLSHNRRTSLQGDTPVSRHLFSSGSDAATSLIKCEVCSKTFKNFEYLSAHMHQHREARFVCDICNKHFTYKCNLKTHMSMHLDTWQFECEACKKRFRDKYAFKKHQLKHTEPQFKCQICGKALTRRPYLIKHYQKMHPDHQESVQS